MEPNEESLKWAAQIKALINDNESLTFVKKTQFDWTILKSRIKHDCTDGILKGIRNSLKHKKQADQSNCILLKALFKCSKCNKEENIFLHESGKITFMNQDSPKETPLSLVTGVGISNTVINSTSELAKPQSYEVKIDITTILEAESPLKFLHEKDQLQDYKRKNPDVDIEKLIEIEKKKNTKASFVNGIITFKVKHLVGKTKSCPYINDIIPEIKKISGCEVNLKNSDSSIYPFKSLSGTHTLATFRFNCRSKGKCGVLYTAKGGGIIVKVLANKSAIISFKPATKTDAPVFKVSHTAAKGVTPRPLPARSEDINATTSMQRQKQELMLKNKTTQGREDIARGWVQDYGQRRRQADKAKDIPPLYSSGKDKVVQNLVQHLDYDLDHGNPSDVLLGNLQMMELRDGLFLIFNIASITLYLSWNQELPLMVDATGIRVKPWRNKKHWYLYTGVMPSPLLDGGMMPIFYFLNGTHTEHAFRFCFTKFINEVKRVQHALPLYGKCSPVPRQIICDMSLVLFRPLLEICNNITMADYQNLLWSHLRSKTTEKPALPLCAMKIDYSHYMAAIMKYNVKTVVEKSKKKERSFLINCYRALFWASTLNEMEMILYSMFVYAYSEPGSTLSRLSEKALHDNINNQMDKFSHFCTIEDLEECIDVTREDALSFEIFHEE